MAIGAGGKKTGWYHGWNIVVVCILASIAASSLPTTGFSLFVTAWSRDLHAPVSTLALGITVFALGCAFLSPFTGVISDRFPTRIVLAGGIAGMAVLSIAMSYVTAIWQYLAIYLLLSAAVLASTTIPANSVVMRWFVRKLGLALGLTSMGLSMAGIVMPPIVAALLPDFGWRLIWRFAGIFIGVVVLPLVLLVIRERPEARDGTHYLSAEGNAAAAQHAHGAKGGDSSLGWRGILGRRNFWFMVVAYLAMLIPYGGAGYNLSPIGASRGLSIAMSSYLLSGWALSQMLATLGSGMLSDKFGNRLPMAGLAFMTAAGSVLVGIGPNFTILMIGSLLVGVGGGFWPLIASALAAEYGAAAFGRAFGMLMLFLPVGSMPAFIVAKSKETTGSYAPALLGMAVVAAIGGISALLLREKRGGHVTPQEEAAVEEATVPLLHTGRASST
jgi:MFS family permease